MTLTCSSCDRILLNFVWPVFNLSQSNFLISVQQGETVEFIERRVEMHSDTVCCPILASFTASNFRFSRNKPLDNRLLKRWKRQAMKNSCYKNLATKSVILMTCGFATESRSMVRELLGEGLRKLRKYVPDLEDNQLSCATLDKFLSYYSFCKGAGIA